MKKFIIELGGMKVSTEAEGIWEKDVRVSNHFVMGLSRTHPRGDPINVSVEDNHLKIGTTKFKCKIQGLYKKEYSYQWSLVQEDF